MGKYDLPTMIDYTTKTTGVSKVTYMGHSMGTSQMFYGISSNQSYFKSKVNLFISAAPITRLDHTTNDLLQVFAGAVTLIGDTLYTFHIYDIFGSGSAMISGAVCGIIPSFCKLMESFAITHDASLDDDDRF